MECQHEIGVCPAEQAEAMRYFIRQVNIQPHKGKVTVAGWNSFTNMGHWNPRSKGLSKDILNMARKWAWRERNSTISKARKCVASQVAFILLLSFLLPPASHSISERKHIKEEWR